MSYFDTFPLTQLTRVVPDFAYSPFQPVPGPTTAPPIDPQYPEHLKSLTNKYTEMSALIAQLSPAVRDSLISMDSRRVATGAPPLTRQQTLLAARTAMTNQEATPAPERNPLDLIGNFRSDLATVLKSIPRLPLAMIHEVGDLPHFAERVQEAQEAGANPLAATLQGPGIRLIPGTFTLANLLSGTKGLREAISHPLYTAMDVLPAADTLAKGTTTGKLLVEAAEQAGKRPRALTGLLTNKAVVNPETGVAELARNRLGQTVDFVREETRPGQAIDAAFGKTSRDVMRARGRLEARYRGLVQGAVKPETPLEEFLPRIAETFQKHADTYPQILDTTEVGEAWRAQVAKDFTTGNIKNYDPAFVNDYRTLVDDIGHEAVARDILGEYGGEFYPTKTVKLLRSRESAVNTTRRIGSLRNEYLNPSGRLTGDGLKAMIDDALEDGTHIGRSKSTRAVMQVMDAYGLPIEGVKSALASLHRARGNWDAVRASLDDVVNGLPDPVAPLQPRRSITDIIDVLKRNTKDRQVTLLETAVRDGKRNRATAALKNLYERKPPTFPEAEWPALREDIRSASRRMEFDAKVGSKASAKRLAQQQRGLDAAINANPPSRFDELLAEDLRGRLGKEAVTQRERALGRSLSEDEAAQLVGAVQERRWGSAFPDMTPEERLSFTRELERDVKATWRMLRDAGEDPIFVHKVSPGRATAAQTGNIGPVPVTASQGKERALDLSPSVGDVQVSLTAQAGELLQDVYRERYANDIIESVGKPEAQLREDLAPFARQRAVLDPTLDFEGHLQEIIRRRYERFNPETAGFSWGGVRLDKFRQEAYYIPKAVAENLHRLVKPPSLVGQIVEPFTNAFRYNVIGLSPQVIANNFLSNAVATMAEAGPGPFKYWSKAKEWLAHPELIPNEELKAMMLTENPALPTLNRDAWLKSRSFQKFTMGQNAYAAFTESAAAEALKRGKSALDGVVEKSLHLQRIGDNIYRGMVYMNEYDNLLSKGTSAEKAAAGAVEQVRRVLVDYSAFTPIERQAIRTIIPFYGYMGHAMRFIGRYPLDHPIRASIVTKLAEAERERLGALPDEFLGMLPLGGVNDKGQQTMIPLRPFSPFGDISDMFSLSGWLSATNPVISTVLESVGVKRGEAEAYPTLRYNPQTGRMEPVTGGLFNNLLLNTIPRAGLFTSALGLNAENKALRRYDPAAANRQLLSMAGIPTIYRSVDVPQEQMRSEVARELSASDVRNEAQRSGDWREALRYPSLRAYFGQVLDMNGPQVADLTPDTPKSIADQLRQLIGV